MTLRHAVHAQHRGLVDVELVIDAAGKVHAVRALPAAQIRLSAPNLSRDPVTGDPVEDLSWHRVGGIVGEAACGATMYEGSVDTVTRPYRLDDQLCTAGCWSPHELAIGRTGADSRRMRALTNPMFAPKDKP